MVTVGLKPRVALESKIPISILINTISLIIRPQGSVDTLNHSDNLKLQGSQVSDLRRRGAGGADCYVNNSCNDFI